MSDIHDTSTTPPRRQCGTMQVHNALLERSPEYRARLATLESATRSRLTRSERVPQTVTIPVVVHVVHRTEAENISKAQIDSQIVALNKDFRATNSDKGNTPAAWRGLVADAGIEFVLASKDPNGQPTDGVTRTRTTKTAFGTDDGVKSAATGGANPWAPDQYLNIWVCTLAGGLLGYAQFPGGPAPTDGVVIRNTAFGTNGTAQPPFNLGRTTTHEIGHWLNLRHIWGDTEDCSGSDNVDDTPNAAGPNYQKPTFPHVSCTNGPNGDMFMNYMDYVDDDSMVMFTSGQAARMHAALATSRTGFLNGGGNGSTS